MKTSKNNNGSTTEDQKMKNRTKNQLLKLITTSSVELHILELQLMQKNRLTNVELHEKMLKIQQELQKISRIIENKPEWRKITKLASFNETSK